MLFIQIYLIIGAVWSAYTNWHVLNEYRDKSSESSKPPLCLSVFLSWVAFMVAWPLLLIDYLLSLKSRN